MNREASDDRQDHDVPQYAAGTLRVLC